MGTFEAAQKAGKSDEKQVTKTKRQRRKDQQKSDKNKWLIQHPKIQSMDRREKIYVKDAGLNETKAEKRQAPIDPKLDLMSPEVKFGRILAGTDQRKRHAAVKKLKAYLKARCDISEVVDGDGESSTGGISELDLLKLWKALWYTLYMADKKPVQDELSKHICNLLWCVVGTEEEDEYAGRAYLEMTEAEEQELMEGDDDDDDDDEGEDEDLVTLEEIENTLKAEMDSDEGEDEEEDDKEESDENEDEEEDESADMMELDDSEIPHCRGAHLVSIFVRTFFRTIRRDWGSMDKYRIDKFYTLIRHMMHEVYEYMSTRSWNYGIILLLNDAIFEEILKQPPNGLRYHLIDLCLEELAKVNAKAKIALTEATFLDVLEPFFGLCQTGRNDDTVQGRVMEKVLDNFLEKYSVISDKALEEEENDNAKEDSLIFSNVHVKTIAEFLFTLGSDPDTKDRYRKSLYDLHKKYMRRLKKIGKDVEIATDEDGNEVYEDEDEDAGVDDVNLNNIDESIRFLESETNGDVENDSDDDLRDGDESDQDEEEEEKVEIEKPKVESKKKKKKRKSIEREADEKPKPGTDNGKDGKRKKKRKSLEALEEDNAPDEEVVITLTEQQDAKKKDRKAKKKLKEQEEEDEKTEDDSADKDSRRVSFGKKNRAKSHKASMKALRTSEPPSTKETAPAKGILRKKPGHSSGVVTKKGRKKATSYF